MENFSNITPCPFCGSNDIKYSTKSITSNGKTIIQFKCYCNSCHSYGPISTSKPIDHNNYILIDQTKKDDMYKQLAINKWNIRNKWNARNKSQCIYKSVITSYGSKKYISSCGYTLGLNKSWIYCPNCGKQIIIE